MEMDKPTLYLETSVPSYLTARPSRDVITLTHQQITREWWDKQRDRYTVYVSETVIREISAGDADAAARRMESIRQFPILKTNEEVERLTEIYIQKFSLPSFAVADAAHRTRNSETCPAARKRSTRFGGANDLHPRGNAV